jgi:hypothetical protein
VAYKDNPYVPTAAGLTSCRNVQIAFLHLPRHQYNLLMSKPKQITFDPAREALLADGVKPESVSPYLAAWRWAESGKTTTGLSDATVKTYEADARRVYQLLGQNPPQ